MAVSSVKARSGSARELLGWTIFESGPVDAAHSILFLPGGLESATFFDGLIADPGLADVPARFVTTTLPGFCGTPQLPALRIESFAESGAALAAELDCEVVVGHSMGANVAIEMAASGRFRGALVLLSPTFSREDESPILGHMDRFGRIPGVGQLVWRAMLKIMPRAMRGELPPAHADRLVAEMELNDPGFCRPAVRRYYEYLDERGSLAERLCASESLAWVGFGEEKGEVGLTDAERETLEKCEGVMLTSIPDIGHFTLGDESGVVPQMLIDALNATTPR